MSNMSYCRFENTYHDLKDCYDNMDDSDLSEIETKYRARLVELCATIAEEYDDLSGTDEEPQ